MFGERPCTSILIESDAYQLFFIPVTGRFKTLFSYKNKIWGFVLEELKLTISPVNILTRVNDFTQYL